LLKYNEWESASTSGLTYADFPKELQPLFSVIHSFHAAGNIDKADLTISDLANLVYAGISKDHPYYKGVLEQIESLDVSDQTSRTLVRSILQNKKLKEISLAAYDVTEGRKSIDDFTSLVEDFKESPVEEVEEFEFVSDDLESIVNETYKAPGLKWRLNTLNKMMGSLRKGDFGFIFARPETGKTTFLASEVTFMAEQLTEDDGPILWINNEEQGKKVKLRTFQAAAGIDLSALLSDIPAAQQRFNQITHGKIKQPPTATFSRQQIEKLCKSLRPSLILLDQVDKVTGFDSDRDDLRLGAIYQWARTLAIEYCPVIAVCQADGTGEGVKWLTMSHVANAKTSKQAEADWILGIGKVNDPGYENLRFLHLSKNKLMGDEGVTDPNLRHGRVEVLIEPTIARYKDLY
jgi:hypothetical protein